MSAYPTVSVGIPTRDRPELVRRAIDGIGSQAYSGPVEIIVVFDGTEPDRSLEAIPGVRVLRNDHKPGLAGARNTAILATSAPWVAFCDDDDVWEPDKLAAQMSMLSAEPSAEFASTGIRVEFGDRSTVRRAGSDRVTHAQLLRSRMSMIHSSTFLIRRAALLDGIGLVDESIPAGQNEDWDLLLRASARNDIVHVDRPLVRVLWGRTSHFSRRWDVKVEALEWLLEHHPDLARDPHGASLVYGQMAFAEACLGQRRRAGAYARQALRHRPFQWRAGASLLVAAGIVDGETVLRALHRFGRGV